MKQIRTLIVDDEELARVLVREYLSTHPEFQIIGECANGFEAVKTISEESPDLVLLDIQMPKLNGFEVLEVADPPPAVIFITAYDEYALKAFEVHAIDYLLKPFSKERFDEALRRAEEQLRSKNPRSLQPLLEDVSAKSEPTERVLVRDGSQVTIIPVETIDYIEALDDYVRIIAGGKKHMKRGTLSSLEKQLPKTRFIRAHRSFILNIDRLSKIELYAKDSRVAILKDGTRIQVSREGYGKLKEILG